jgi:hypothetical protein
MKPVNVGMPTEWGDWTGRAIRTRRTIDLDAIAVDDGMIVAPDDDTIFALLAEWSLEPAALIEVKRGTVIPVARWAPFAADRGQYKTLLNLARRASIPLFAVYYERVERIDDGTVFSVWLLDEVEPAYAGPHELMPAADFAARLPFVFDEQIVASWRALFDEAAA